MKIRLSEKSRSKGVITCDGFKCYEIDHGDEIEIKVSNKKIKSITFTYFSGLRSYKWDA